MLLMQNFSVCVYGFGTTRTPKLAVRVKPPGSGRSLYRFVEKLVFRCAEDQFQPAGYAHLIEDGSQVVLHRLIADRQFYGDILIGVSGQNGCDDLAFTGRDADSNPCNAKSQKREEVRKSAGVCTTVFSYVRQRLLNDPCNFTAHTRRQCDIFVVADKLC